MINVVYVNMCLFCSHVWIFTFNDPYCPGYPHSPTFLGFSFWLLAVHCLCLLQVVKDRVIENWSGWTTRKQKTGVGGWPENKAIGWVPVSRPLHLFNTSNKIACCWFWKQGYIYQTSAYFGREGQDMLQHSMDKASQLKLQSQSSAQSVQLMRYWPDVALWLFMLYSFNKIQIVFINMI